MPIARRSFDAWVEAECVRLNDRSERLLAKWMRYQRPGRVWAVVELAATLVAVALILLGHPIATLPMWIAAHADSKRRHVDRRQALLMNAMVRVNGRIRGLVEAASHPSRAATLIARVPFDVVRGEAPN